MRGPRRTLFCCAIALCFLALATPIAGVDVPETAEPGETGVAAPATDDAESSPVAADVHAADTDALAQTGDLTQSDALAQTGDLTQTGDLAQTDTIPAGEATREAYAETGIDVASAVATETATVQSQFRTHRFEQRFDAANDSERMAVVEDTGSAIAVTMNATDQRHAAAISDYSAGTLSTSAFLRELIHVRATTTGEADLARHVSDVVDEEDDVSLPPAVQSQFTNITAEISALPAPVLDAYASGVSGEPIADPLYVQTSSDGVVLALPADVATDQDIFSVDQEPSPDVGHTVQATLRDERATGAPDQFAQAGQNRIVAALERSEELYPGVSITSVSAPFGDTNVYRAAGRHENRSGALQAYLDGGTTNVFHELQVVDADELSASATNSTGGVTVTVDASAPTGPMRISVAGSGDAIADATVSVGETVVGTTDSAGLLRTTQPLNTGAVTVETAAGVTVTVDIP